MAAEVRMGEFTADFEQALRKPMVSDLPKSTKSFAAHAFVEWMAIKKMGDLGKEITLFAC